MDKASGVYLTLTDNSFQTSGSSSLNLVIPMFTTKGEIGLNVVTANTFEDVLGYDLDYNSNYYGLKTILENVTKATVWRVNQNAKLANVYYTNESKSETDADSFEDITNIEGVKYAVALKNVGNYADCCVKFQPTVDVQVVTNDNATTTDEQTIYIENVTDDTTTYGETTIYKGIIFYNSTDNAVVGVIDSEGKVLKVVDGVVTDTEVGTMTISSDDATITLESPISNDTFWNIHTIPSDVTEWTMVQATKKGTKYTVNAEIEFSTEETSDIYWKNVDFGDYQFYLKDDSVLNEDYVLLDNGSNGDTTLNVTEMDVSVLADSGCNILLMNGITDYKVVNRLVSTCEKNKIHIFADAPAYKSYADLQTWAKKITNSNYVAIGARADKVEFDDESFIYVYPSVNYAYIYSKMLDNQGTLNYPPAGATYGTIVANDLMECDYALYGDELKTNRINWQLSNDNGTMMWEQRTTYALDTDLSYIAPNFIVDALTERLVTYERNFNFRYMTASDLLTQESGLKSILDEFVTNDFLYSYELKVPTYEEAQSSGRTLNIEIAIVVMRDAEVININLELRNS